MLFYRVPKLLFTNERYRNLSAESKLLYGLFLDRMGILRKNGWVDKDGRVLYSSIRLKTSWKHLAVGIRKRFSCSQNLRKRGISSGGRSRGWGNRT